MIAPTIRRFHATAGVVTEGSRSVIVLNGRPLHTPDGALLAVPGHALAEAIAAEWQAQDGRIHPATMPLTCLANTAIDRIAAMRPQVVEALLAFAATDLVCYYAVLPSALVERQQATWQPLLDWVAWRYEARLAVTEGLTPVPQPSAALAALRLAIRGMDAFRLTALQGAAVPCGSLVVALALIEGEIDAEAAFAAAQLEA
ncbi:MAG: chaperone required for the assembly of the mitochondrial F1-ATPase, partial [Rhodospirillaceae bacterium]